MSYFDRMAPRSRALKDNPYHDKIGQFTSKDRAQGVFEYDQYKGLDKHLIDYKKDRPLNDPSKVLTITKVVSGAKFVVPYSSVPFFDQLNKLQGTPNPNAVPIDTYVKAREKLFGKQPVEKIAIKDLTFTQTVVNKDKVAALVEQKENNAGMVVKYGGATYLMDGHHGAIARAIRGKKNIKAHVLTLGKVKKFLCALSI